MLAAIDAVHASGLSSWSLDIISGLPRLTMDSWQHTLKEAVAAQPTHMSVYDLQVCLRVRYEDPFGMLACVCIQSVFIDLCLCAYVCAACTGIHKPTPVNVHAITLTCPCHGSSQA